MRRGGILLLAALAVSGCGSSGNAISAQKARATFAAHGLRLTSTGYHRFGPIKHVLYLSWVGGGGVKRTRTGLVVSGARSFLVLVFPTTDDASTALRDPSVARFLRDGHVPAVKRKNMILTTKTPVADSAAWPRWKAIFDSVG